MILMYHHVAPREQVPSDPRDGWNLNITPTRLRAHIELLRADGCRFVSLDEMVSTIVKRGFAHPRTVAVTLDDGWLDNYQHAFPVFQELDVPATFFVTTGHLRGGAADARKMTVAQLRDLLAHGMTIGGHSRTHPTLSKLPRERVREEILGCKLDLEDTLGTGVAHFAYPGGDFDRVVAALTQEVGYQSACSVVGLGVNTRRSMFWLHREVLTDGANTFADRCRRSFLARVLLTPRARRRIRMQLKAASAGARRP